MQSMVIGLEGPAMINRFSKVLVVDDSGVARKIVRGLLYRLGIENVDEAANGRDALAKLEARHYALIISDWDMAPMNGLELLKHVRKADRWQMTPFIMATAMSHVRFAEIARDSGATHFLPKPFTLDMLSRRIAEVDAFP